MPNNDNRFGDVIDSNSSRSSTEGSSARAVEIDNELLSSIDSTLTDILHNMGNMSQSAARGSMPGGRRDANKWRNPRRNQNRRGSSGGGTSIGGLNEALDKFTEGIEDALLDSLGVSGFKEQIAEALSDLADGMNTEVAKLPEELGKELGKQLLNTGPGKAIAGKVKDVTSKAMDGVMKSFQQGQNIPLRQNGNTNFREAIQTGWNNGVDSMRNRSQSSGSTSSGPSAQDIQNAVDTANQAQDIANMARGNGSNVIQFPGNPSASAGTEAATQAGAEAATSAATSAAGTAATAGGAEAAMAAGSGEAAMAAGTAAAAGGAEAGVAAAGTAAAAGGAEAAGVAAAGTAAAGAGTALAGLASAAAAACPYILIAVAALIAIDKAFDALAPAVEGTKKLFNEMKKAANRYQESRKKNLELEKKRIADDVQSMIEEPFNILKSAAENLYNTWDNQLSTIAGTQGYSKEDVQDLMSAYAQRLRDEGLTSVVSGSDIMDNLSAVLKAGLSGTVAEEFSYLATKLNAAVPTQDFFSYADTYASVAANAIAAGKSQAEAISYANAEMETFASNVLFASRELSGGFATGLKDAQQLFTYAVQIANASKTGDAATISGVLTSVSAITGAVAPDLASSLVEAVVKAATGGNSSEIVALRSLAGINASNTEFLKALSQDPQGVFAALFSNLAKMQKMSDDNFMEVAEGLSSVFGISMDAFARVDFQYLADAINQMNVNSSSLDENMQLLASGQTTSTAEQMRMAQVNQYMLEEGLAYVLDNEVARSIQEHMWQEQIARELQEAEYAVNLQGAALEFLEGIKQTVDNIKNFLNPFSFLKKLTNLKATSDQAAALKADTLQLLELGKVGNGNPQSLYQLTTTNKDLGLVQSITELMGGFSLYGASKKSLQAFNNITNYSGWASGTNLSGLLGLASKAGSYITKSPNSMYSWGNVSKSTSSAISASASASGYGSSSSSSSSSADSTSASEAIKAKSNAAFDKFMETMEAAVKDNKSYDEWVKTAKLFGISDFSKALEDAGRSEAEVKGAFGDQEAKEASEYKHNRELIEDEYWRQAIPYMKNEQEPWTNWENLVTTNQTEIMSRQDTLIELLGISNTQTTSIAKTSSRYLQEWTNYYVKHTAYSDATLNAFKASDIMKAEKKEQGDAVLALANALTENMIGIQEGFKDPAVQTNVLLAKILIVAEAIMQQNNKTGGLSLPDALSALGLGMTTETTTV